MIQSCETCPYKGANSKLEPWLDAIKTGIKDMSDARERMTTTAMRSTMADLLPEGASKDHDTSSLDEEAQTARYVEAHVISIHALLDILESPNCDVHPADALFTCPNKMALIATTEFIGQLQEPQTP